jgi:hypothetical protein
MLKTASAVGGIRKDVSKSLQPSLLGWVMRAFKAGRLRVDAAARGAQRQLGQEGAKAGKAAAVSEYMDDGDESEDDDRVDPTTGIQMSGKRRK